MCQSQYEKERYKKWKKQNGVVVEENKSPRCQILYEGEKNEKNLGIRFTVIEKMVVERVVTFFDELCQSKAHVIQDIVVELIGF